MVLLSLLAVGVGHFEQYGVKIVGDIPAGLPQFQWAGVDLAALQVPEARQLVRLACACFLLSYIESVSAARTFALKHSYDVDPRQELLGLGAASLLAGLFQGYPIAGGLSQTAVNERGGARTPLSLVFASAAICCVLLFLTGLFRTLPDAVLAAVVLVAVKGLIDLRELRHLWRVSRLDFAAAAVALAGVLLMGVLDGVLIAVLASVVMLLARSSRPHVAFLGRIPGTNRFSDLARHPDNEPIPGVLAFRVQSSLLYFNVDHVLDVGPAARQGASRAAARDLRSVECPVRRCRRRADAAAAARRAGRGERGLQDRGSSRPGARGTACGGAWKSLSVPSRATASLAELLENYARGDVGRRQWLHWPPVTILKMNPHQGTHHEH